MNETWLLLDFQLHLSPLHLITLCTLVSRFLPRTPGTTPAFSEPGIFKHTVSLFGLFLSYPFFPHPCGYFLLIPQTLAEVTLCLSWPFKPGQVLPSLGFPSQAHRQESTRCPPLLGYGSLWTGMRSLFLCPSFRV